ncbi:unnamed protein product [Brachionus calyciflorus]|uniref:EGF-like domain-containing protein n=1 Tax=Brachionus calyciflorus TaxID=104777 RepID=A0A814FN62_9BILA|nr:unnamed protein product [Brachionus calyciflorus]
MYWIFKILIISIITTTIFCDSVIFLWYNKTSTLSLTIEANISSVSLDQENNILIAGSKDKIILLDILNNNTFFIKPLSFDNNTKIINVLSLNQTTFLFANQTSLFFYNISGYFIEEIYIGEIECLRYLKEDDIILIGSDKKVITYNLKIKIFVNTSVNVRVVRAIEFLNRDFIVLQCDVSKICICKLNLNNSLEIMVRNPQDDKNLNIGLVKIVNETLILYGSSDILIPKQKYEKWNVNDSWVSIQANVGTLSAIENVLPDELILSGYIDNINVLNIKDYNIRIDDTFFLKIEQPGNLNFPNKDLNQSSTTRSGNTNVSENNLTQLFSFSSTLTENPKYILSLMSTNIDINDCLLNCSSHGICKQINQKFICECFTNYAGSNCQLNILPCASNPCLNNGTCTNNLFNKSFSCECLKNANQTSLYYGSFCESKIDICENETCSKNGVCYDFNNEAKCKCYKSYLGEKCENESSEIKEIKLLTKATTIIAIGVLISAYLIVLLLDSSNFCCKERKKTMIFKKEEIIKPYYVNSN